MFSDQVIIFGFILFVFIVLIIFIKYWPFKIYRQKTSILKYKKLDLIKGDIKLLADKEFEQEVAQLAQNGYELSSLRELYNFTEHQKNLPEKVFIILMDYEVPYSVKSLIIELLKHNINVIFFKPVIQDNEPDSILGNGKGSLRNELTHSEDSFNSF